MNKAVRSTSPAPAGKPINLALNQRELFVDKYLVEQMKNVDFELHHPQQQPLAKSSLVNTAYITVIKDGDLYKAFYREYDPNYTGGRHSGNPGEMTCYAESRDGHEWTFPDLGVVEKIEGKKHNNVLFREIPFSTNFCPFLDTNPNAKPEERFKAFAGHPGQDRSKKAEGLYHFVSADGIHWRKFSDKPAIEFNMSWPHAFDSMNVGFWSEAEGCYVLYFRTYIERPGTNDLRSISRSTSPDFENWSEPVPIDPNLPDEELYTSQTQPYFRAPHIYVAFPTRFMVKRDCITDILFMSSRAGSCKYDRLFTEPFIRPGLDPTRWGNRSNYMALNTVPTGENEISFYHSRSGYRYTLRTDGFISIKAGAETGELITKPLTFDGNKLSLNVSTSAAGGIRVEILDENGSPVPGFTLNDCQEFFGDTIDHTVNWTGTPELKTLAGKTVRLRFVMNECDLYSFVFEN